MSTKAVKWLIFLAEVMILSFLGTRLLNDFLGGCQDGPGTNLSCKITLGMKAEIAGVAEVRISSYDPFSVVIENSDGVQGPVMAVKADGYHYSVGFGTGGNVTVYMVEDKSHGLFGPTMIVDKTEEGEYPLLTVSRTNHALIAQVFRYDMLPLVFVWLVMTVFVLYFTWPR